MTTALSWLPALDFAVFLVVRMLRLDETSAVLFWERLLIFS
jgi:hypothetical protein